MVSSIITKDAPVIVKDLKLNLKKSYSLQIWRLEGQVRRGFHSAFKSQNSGDMIVKTERAETGKAGNFVVNAGDSEGV